MLVVADGVGGWSLKGVDPSIFSRNLTRSIVDCHTEKPSLTAKACLINGCRKASQAAPGSAVVVVLKLFDNLTIKAANLGDCGYALFHILENDTL